MKTLDDLFYQVTDPKSSLNDCPATTILLHRVCDNNQNKFEEAIRLINLFMKAAYDLGKQHAKEPDPKACPCCGAYANRCVCD